MGDGNREGVGRMSWEEKREGKLLQPGCKINKQVYLENTHTCEIKINSFERRE